jgi:hypothetical protein
LSITETIDQAIRDYGVGPDAMRWSPGEPASDPARVVHHFVPGMIARWDVDFVEGMRGLGTALGVWFDEVKRLESPEEQARRARLRRMHSAHPAKWRKAR